MRRQRIRCRIKTLARKRVQVMQRLGTAVTNAPPCLDLSEHLKTPKKITQPSDPQARKFIMSIYLQPYVSLRFTHKLIHLWLSCFAGFFWFIVLCHQCGVFCLPVSFLGILTLDFARTCLGLVKLCVGFDCGWSVIALWGGICVGNFECGMPRACWFWSEFQESYFVDTFFLVLVMYQRGRRGKNHDTDLNTHRHTNTVLPRLYHINRRDQINMTPVRC